MLSETNGKLCSRRRLRGWLLATLLLLLPAAAAAQEAQPTPCDDIPCPPIRVVVWGTVTNCAGQPVPGDYDGDGRADIAVQRPDFTGAWWIIPSSTGSYYVVSN